MLRSQQTKIDWCVTLSLYNSLKGFIKRQLDDFLDERHRRRQRKVADAGHFGELTRRGREYYNRLRWEKGDKSKLDT
jgi:hypothetical protein